MGGACPGSLKLSPTFYPPPLALPISSRGFSKLPPSPVFPKPLPTSLKLTPNTFSSLIPASLSPETALISLLHSPQIGSPIPSRLQTYAGLSRPQTPGHRRPSPARSHARLGFPGCPPAVAQRPSLPRQNIGLRATGSARPRAARCEPGRAGAETGRGGGVGAPGWGLRLRRSTGRRGPGRPPRGSRDSGLRSQKPREIRRV